jgi:hypothetical protein
VLMVIQVLIFANLKKVIHLRNWNVLWQVNNKWFTIFVALLFLSNIDYKICFLNDAQLCLMMHVAIFAIAIN